MFLLKPLGENFFTYLFHLLEVACIPWLVVPFPIFKDTRLASSHFSLTLIPASVVTSLSLPHILLPPFYKDLCNYTGTTQIIQGNLPFQNPKFSLTCKVLLLGKVTYSQDSGIKIPLRGALFSLPHNFL